jgi:nucleotide-binding universal stress UspA family protein
MFKKILVPTDGSEHSERAIRIAIEIAQQSKGSIVGLCVAQPYPYSPLSEGAVAGDAAEYERQTVALAEKHTAKILSAAKEMDVPCETVVTKSFKPSKEIIEVAKSSQCDAVVMASHGRKGLSKLILGSETQNVLAHADIPVLVCR